MEEPQAKRLKQDANDEAIAASTSQLDPLEDLTVANAKLIVQHLDTLQQAYQAELSQLLEQLKRYQERTSIDAPAAESTEAGRTPQVEQQQGDAGQQSRKTPEAAADLQEADATDKAEGTPEAAGADGAANGAAAGAQPPEAAAAEVPAAPLQLQPQSQQLKQQLPLLTGLEGLASALAAQDMDDAGALACLCGTKVRYLIKRYAVTIGRDTFSKGTVDIDLGQEGDARQVSRQQAQLAMDESGRFSIRAVGRQRMALDGRVLQQGEVAELQHLSLIEIAGMKLLFLVNPVAVRRLLERTSQVVL